MRGRLDDERGFTLVELLVTMSILALAMALITGSAIFLQRAVRQTQQRLDDLAQARLAMDATTMWLRGAVTAERSDTAEDRQPFTLTQRRRVDFLSNVRATDASGDPAPQRVRLEVTPAGELEERVWPGRINAAGQWTQAGGPRTRIIARGIAEEHPFTFFDADGNEITPTSEGNLTQAEREAVRYVGVNVVVQQSPGVDVPPSQLSSRVGLPNQFFYDVEGGQ
jgi:prepilin-type N-terminal cleavage/methylation domain-containing protein